MLTNSSIFVDGKEFISATRASKKIGYAADYVGQLCRAKKIPAKLIGKTWYVDFSALVEHKKHRHLGRAKKVVTQQPQFQPSELITLERTLPKIPPFAYRGEKSVESWWALGLFRKTLVMSLFLIVVTGAGLLLLGRSSSRVATEVDDSQLANASVIDGAGQVFEDIINGFRELKDIALRKIFLAVRSPKSSEVSEATTTAVTNLALSLDLESLKGELKGELENYVRLQLDTYVKSPIIVYSSSPTLATADFESFKDNEVTQAIYYSVTNQSDSDMDHLSSRFTQLTNDGSFVKATFETICLGGVCETSWPSGGSGSDFAWTPTSWGNSTSTTLGFLSGFLSTASSTFSGGFNADRSTTTNATTTTFFSTTASSTDLFAATGNIGTLTVGSCIGCGTGGAFAFTPTTYGTQSVNSTSTGLWLTGSPLGLIASTTFATFSTSTNATSTNLFATNASSTNFYGAGLAGGSGCASTSFLQYDGAGRFGCGTPSGSGAADTFWATTTSTLNPNAIFANGGNNTLVGIGTSTPMYQLTVASSTGPQLSLSDSAGIAQWAFRNAGGNLYFATTTVAGTATTTLAALTIIGSSGKIGIATSSPYAKLSIHAVGDGSNDTLFAIGSTTAAGVVSTLFSVDNKGLTTVGNSSGTGDANFQFASDDNAWSVGYYSTDKSFRIASSTDLNTNVALTISKGGNVGIGTTTPVYRLTIASSTALTDGAGYAQWVTRNAGGNLYFATTTIAGTATTSISALEISGSGFGTTTIRGLNIIGQATSTSNVGYNVTTGCFAVNGSCLTSGSSFAFTPDTYNSQTVNSTSTGFWLKGSPLGLIASSTFATYATSTNATSTNLFSTTASSSNLFTALFNGAGLTTCTSNNVLTWSGGTFGCEADDNSGSSFAFTNDSYG
ncbi:MAG: hypothetical protein WAW81_02415, partial [Minisyncoccia bacterium]